MWDYGNFDIYFFICVKCYDSANNSYDNPASTYNPVKTFIILEKKLDDPQKDVMEMKWNEMKWNGFPTMLKQWFYLRLYATMARREE